MPSEHSEDVIEGAYLRDILAQPQALSDTLAALQDTPMLAALAQRVASGGFKRIVLTGMGSSLHVMHAVHACFVERGFTALMLETAELIHYQLGLLTPDTLVIAASQSGESAEIIRLLEANRGRATIIGVTNTAASTLARQAHAVVVTQAGDEAAVSCKTYVAALVALTWLAERLTGADYARVQQDLGAAPAAVAGYLSTWREHVQALRRELQGVRHVFFVGRGRSLAAACTAGLTTKESTHVCAEGMSCAAFRHGPFEALCPEVFTLVFEGDPPTRELNARLAEDIVRAGGTAALVSEKVTASVFRLPPAPAAVSPILEILPVQMVTLALAAVSGREAGKFVLASKVTVTE